MRAHGRLACFPRQDRDNGPLDDFKHHASFLLKRMFHLRIQWWAFRPGCFRRLMTRCRLKASRFRSLPHKACTATISAGSRSTLIRTLQWIPRRDFVREIRRIENPSNRHTARTIATRAGMDRRVSKSMNRSRGPPTFSGPMIPHRILLFRAFGFATANVRRLRWKIQQEIHKYSHDDSQDDRAFTLRNLPLRTR